ncbi:MAG: zinc ribbon domain-containing protein [Bacteroidaceae bacterium]|nr:zinc ribbon domain-containing protein [Bacteroidaceae bacterium]
MSLIKCPECDHQVSSRARVCPACGVDIAGNVKRCPVCGGFVLMDADTCPHCDARFLVEHDDAEPQEPEKKATTVPPPTPASDPNDDSSEKKQRKVWGWYVVVVVLLAAAFGGYWYWDYLTMREQEEKAYKLLTDCNDTLSYKDFIIHFPESEHADEVKSRLEQLRAIQAEWSGACKAQSAKALQDFIEAHPESPLRNEALAMIDSLDWVTAVSAADSANTMVSIEAYEQYAAKHAEGHFITEAYSAIEALKKRAALFAAKRDSTKSDDNAVTATEETKEKTE